MMAVIRMLESVPSTRCSSICNVVFFGVPRSSLLIASTDFMIVCAGMCVFVWACVCVCVCVCVCMCMCVHALRSGKGFLEYC